MLMRGFEINSLEKEKARGRDWGEAGDRRE